MSDMVLGTDDAAQAALDQLATEQVVAGLEDLDTRPAPAVVDLLLASEARVPDVLAEARGDLVRAVEIVASGLAAGGRLVYVGAGTAGRIAALDAVECRPTFGVPEETIIALLAGGSEAAGAAFEAAEDDVDAARTGLEQLAIGPEDVVVGVTASGRTPYVVQALRIANAAGGSTVAVTNNADSPVSGIADHTVELLTGPEVVAGSTRLSAATAQKVALNVISTAAMIRCGRTYGAWMVGVQPTNAKLDVRARRILQQASGRTAADVTAALEETEAPDVALIMLLADVDAAEAQRRLAVHHGHVRRAIHDDIAT